MNYSFIDIEKKWRKYWSDNQIYKVDIDNSKPKFYVLDMFPYPSGAGLHVGHPLGYIASDIYSRYKRLLGFNVLHPMGYDAFGLPAEQYAIHTGQHPAITTENNIRRYREQMDKIGFSFDWSREVRTCDPKYYHWTQWVFIKLFHSWYNNKTQKAEPIEQLVAELERNGNLDIYAACSPTPRFYAEVWRGLTDNEKQEILLNYRLAYLADTMVNWCGALGTVLANDEVSNGFSVRGGHPVEQKVMRQWSLRVSAYAQRLLDGLDKIEWTESLKEIQRNWIGRSEGAEVYFPVLGSESKIKIFTTRPDTIYGATFMVLAPEHDLVPKLTTLEQQDVVNQYIAETNKRTERERISETKTISGVFTGAYAINPFTRQNIPIWISDYVLAGYGTGAIMAVPAHDTRDYAFAQYFGLQIIEVVSGGDISTEAYDAKDGIMVNSGIINGLDVKQAIPIINDEIEKLGIGNRKINFRMRDAIFSRQRYWGEPFPVYYVDGLPYTFDEKDLPLELPEVDKYLPTEKGEPPLGRAQNWKTKDGYPIEMSTMPGFAGSSAYYIRYMDPRNENELVSKESNEYWRNVDLYIGGNEHATGHLIYSRFWNKFLFDLGLVCEDEPFKKLINQGMIQGRSSFVYRVNSRKYAEHEIWEAIKNNNLGYIFKRDISIDHEVFNFSCEEVNLVIEILPRKNASEFYNQHAENLQRHGIRLMLLFVEDIIENIQAVIERLKNILTSNEELCKNYDTYEPIYQPLFISCNLVKEEYQPQPIHVDISFVKNDILDLDRFRNWNPENENALFVLEDGHYLCGHAVEKMSKSMYNVVNPDQMVELYGADTLRLYEMFLGPLEQSKPWDTNGIEGVHRFLRKVWNLCHDKLNQFNVSDEAPTAQENKALHKTIKSVRDDIERFSFNTAVSAFMIGVNELTSLNCNKREVVEKLIVALAPFAPHITEELWHLLGHETTICDASFPKYNEEYLKDDTYIYPVAFNGKRRFELTLPVDFSNQQIEQAALTDTHAQRWLDNKQPKKVIIVPGRMINIVM